jgi:MFS family permease
MLSFRRLPRLYWLLLTGALVNRLGTFVTPMLAIYLTTARGLSITGAGLILATQGAGGVCSGPLGGFLADRLGRRRTLILALFAGAATMLNLSAARELWHIAAAAFLQGLFGDLYRPAVSATISDLVDEKDRGLAFGNLYWVANLGVGVGSALAGFLAMRGWELLFYGDAFTTAAFGVIIWWKMPETRPAHAHKERVSLLAPARNGRFVLFVILNALTWTMMFQGFSTLPIDVKAHGFSTQAYGWLIAFNCLLIVLLQPFVSRLTDPFPRHRTLAVSALLIGGGFGLFALVHSLAGFFLASVVWTLGEIAMAGLGPAVAADAAPDHQRGAYQGFFQLGVGCATLLAPALGPALLDRFGSRVLWSCVAALGFAVALGQLKLGTVGQRKRSTSAQTTIANETV